jgi:hypothetical protein
LNDYALSGRVRVNVSLSAYLPLANFIRDYCALFIDAFLRERLPLGVSDAAAPERSANRSGYTGEP